MTLAHSSLLDARLAKTLAPLARTGIGHLDVGGVPDGYDAIILGLLAEGGQTPVVHVARDDARMARIADWVAFFAPEVEILPLPAWDCMPYDRVSPSGEVMSRRLATLARLAPPQSAAGAGPKRLVLTTVNALLQRLPPRAAIAANLLSLRPKTAMSLESVAAFLARAGYARADTAREPGDFSVRGGILDIYPTDAASPVRLDFFGDEIEQLRGFDPVSQRSTAALAAVEIGPASEVTLDGESMRRFRQNYRELAGPVTGADRLYEAVAAGRRYSGMEHWLPLFYDKLETLFDYVPDAVFALDHQTGEARDIRLETIADYFEARRQFLRAGDPETPYHPVAPDRIYLAATEWDRLLGDRRVLAFSPFQAPPDAAVQGKSLDAGGRGGRDFAPERNDPDRNVFDELRKAIEACHANGQRVILAAYSPGSADRLQSLMREHGLARATIATDFQALAALPAPAAPIAILPLERGFVMPGTLFVTEQDILGDRLARPPRRRRRAEQFIAEVTTLTEGNLVVHVDHGIGRYEGLETLTVGGAPHDCLRVVYDGGDKLFVPVENIEVLSRYGSEEAGDHLDRLGSVSWQARSARVRQRIRDMADRLLKVAAAREILEAPAMTPPAGLYEEFCARFPYAETEDQLRAVDDVLADLASGKPMDRLICGDVGFGKTEVALRAAFVAASSGWQVAVVTPTTLLGRQHDRTFRARFAGFPLRVEPLSRLTPARQAETIKADMASGKLDLVIGTHALLSKTVSFKRLGLVIVDEEQHFGVAQKERLKQLAKNVHVLTLTATPIPRTLQLALSGVRSMSAITTPPIDRLAVRTFILPYDPVVVREALMRERLRGGQSFYVCPRIQDIPGVLAQIKALVPELRVTVAHGGMGTQELERAMSSFYEGGQDLLLSTQIIESGLDIPSANTLIVHRADMLGLAQLYQLRGRIGRAKTRGYAYLTLPQGRELTAGAQRRLEVLQTLDSLGAGFTLASHDLDIRGAGNLLGEEQSGHIREVGIELYQQLLEEAVAEARTGGKGGEAVEAHGWTPQLAIGTPVLIPESYVEDLSVRLGLYRRLSILVGRAEIDAFAAELIDRFGPLPEEVENLLDIIAIKQLCRDAGVEKLDVGPKGIVVAFRNNRFADPATLVDLIQKSRGAIKLRPDHRLVVQRGSSSAQDRIDNARRILESLAAAAKGGAMKRA